MIEYAELEDSALQKLAADGDSYAEEELVSRYMRPTSVSCRGRERGPYSGGNVRAALGSKAV